MPLRAHVDPLPGAEIMIPRHDINDSAFPYERPLFHHEKTLYRAAMMLPERVSDSWGRDSRCMFHRKVYVALSEARESLETVKNQN